ncbi:MAG TPA: hypothetical protein V6D04_00030, partial [Candidatus Obscuribacterales bacterium]
MTLSDRAGQDSFGHRVISAVTSETFVYVVKRLLQALLTLLLASALSFAIIQLAPGDYLDTLRQNPKISPERIQELQQQFGLDKPMLEQYGRWLWQIFQPHVVKIGPVPLILPQGNFGTSFVYQRSVAALLWE